MDETQKAMIVGLAEGDTKMKSYAEAVLALIGDTSLTRIPEQFDMPSERRGEEEAPEAPVRAMDQRIVVYPNPFNNNFNLDYSFADEADEVTIEVLGLAVEKWASTDTTVVLNSSDTAKLMDIALLCPYRFGPAVYRARGLLFTPDSVWFAIRNECEFGAEPVEPSLRLAESETEEGADEITDTHAKVYPNPTTGTLHIDLFYDEKDIATWRMIDLTGRTVHTGPVSSGHSQQVTDMHNLQAGVYLLQLQLNGAPEKVWRIVLTGTDSR